MLLISEDWHLSHYTGSPHAPLSPSIFVDTSEPYKDGVKSTLTTCITLMGQLGTPDKRDTQCNGKALWALHDTH